MGTTDYGTQSLCFDFKQLATSLGFNRINHNLVPVGIYEGGTLTYKNASQVTVSALTCIIEDSAITGETDGVSVRIKTQNTVDVTVSSANPYVVLKFEWSDTENNYMDFEAESYANVVSNPDWLVIGRTEWDGATLLTTFDYTRRSYSPINTLKDKYDELTVKPNEPADDEVYVEGGVDLIINNKLVTVSAGSSSSTISATTLGRIDLVYIDDTGSISILEGIDSGSPTIPYISNVLPIAYITRGASETIVRGSHITQIKPSREGGNNNVIISTQSEFNSIIERVAANQYKIKDSITSIRVKHLSGGYQMSGGSSPLVGGDTWGYIETNNCTNIYFESNAFIDFDTTQGYIEINKEECVLENVNIQGDSTTAAAIQRSFLLSENYIVLNNCSASLRKTNYTGRASVFEGNDTYKETCKLINCTISKYYATGTTLTHLSGFYKCHNMVNCQISEMESDATTAIIYTTGFDDCENAINCSYKDSEQTGGNFAVETFGFINCNYIENCTVDNVNENMVSADSIYLYHDCTHIVNCVAQNCTGNSSNAVGFHSNNYLSGCYANNLDGTGFGVCDNISSCHANNVSNGFDVCNNISSCTAENNTSRGFFGCNQISGSKAYQNTGYGFSACNNVSGCIAEEDGRGFDGCDNISGSKALSNGDYGFRQCENITSCKAENNTSHGFFDCHRISGCESIDNNRGFEDCNFITSSLAQNNTQYGFLECNSIGHNRATGNGIANYSASYADFAGTVAPADTSAGGWNA